MTMNRSGKRVLIVATHGYERSEFHVPLDALQRQGAEVQIASLEKQPIRSWANEKWGDTVSVDDSVADIKAEQYDALVLPGGQINPDVLRTKPDVIALIRAFYEQGKVVAAICHAPWLLVEADLLRGQRATSYPSVRTDVINAGGKWTDEAVVADNRLITSRNPDDLPDFISRISEELLGDRHGQPQEA
jgi:protease I